MADFDFSDVWAAARKVPKFDREGRWRCVVYLSAFDWMHGWLRQPNMAQQSVSCKAWLASHDDLRRCETVRNRNASRNVHIAFEELMDVVENRRADCVIVPDISVFATCFSEARFYVEEVLVPMGFRFIDCARRFDSANGGVRKYLKGLQGEMYEARSLHREHDRLSSGELIRRNVPYGYVFDESAEGCARVDEAVARFVPMIFELASRERWWQSKLVAQVEELGCPGIRQRTNELYGLDYPSIEGWDMVSIRRIVTNRFYLGDFVPEDVASVRLKASGIPLDSFARIEGHHPALVTGDLFAAANEGLRRNYRACPTEAEGRKPCHG